MNTLPASGPNAFDAFALLLALSVACSSASATSTPQYIELEIETLASCVRELVAKTWIDEDQNGIWDKGEPPLEYVQLWMDYTYAGSDRQYKNISDERGVARFGFEVGCYGRTSLNVVAVYAEPPVGFQHTTAERDEKEPYSFGFTYADAPTPDPTASPSP